MRVTVRIKGKGVVIMNSLKMVLVVSLVMLLAGCATWPRKEARLEGEQAVLDTAPILRFADIPVPVGFKIIRDRSFTFQNDIARVGLLRYAGHTNIDKVVAFYKEQMTLYNWNLVNLVEYGTKILNFEKGNQSCIITIEASVTTTFLTIALSPKTTKAIKKAEEK